MPMAIDGNFLKLNNNLKIPKTTKVFARMDPSSKSLIIKKLKQNYEE
jgi:magnesium-transporting ATPase (P-type)